MRVVVVNPNSSSEMTRNIEVAAKNAASPSTEIMAISPRSAPSSIESFAEDLVASYQTVQEVLTLDQAFDGVVVACYYDPAVSALREVLDVPVVGIAEASMHIGSLLAPKFSIVTVLERGVAHVEDVVGSVGLAHRCASVRAVELGVLDLDSDFDVSVEHIEHEARLALTEDGAEAILLGCAGMGPLNEELQKRLSVPVLDGVGCGVSLIEACINNRVTTSKVRTFARPPRKSIHSLDPLLERFERQGDAVLRLGQGA